MFSLKKSEKKWKGSKPESVKQLTENLVVEVWEGKGRNGPRYDWNVVRVGKNEGQTYKTKRPQDLLEMPLFVADLAEVFAEHSGIDGELRSKLARLSISLKELVDNFKSAPVWQQDANGASTVSNGLFAN